VSKTARIRFIVYWKKENAEQEIRIVLPELHFEKTSDLKASKIKVNYLLLANLIG